MKKLLTYRAFKFVASCQLVDQPHLKCEAVVIEPCEDVQGTIRALRTEINDMLDAIANLITDPAGTYAKLDRHLVDFQLASDDSREPTQDERDNEKVLTELRDYADRVWIDKTESPDFDKRARNTMDKLNIIRRAVEDALFELSASRNATMNELENMLERVARKYSYAGAKEALTRNTTNIVTKALRQYDAETVGDAHEDEAQKKTRKPGGGRKRTFDIDRRQVMAVLTLALQTARPSARSYCTEIIRRGKDDEGRPFSEPFTDAKKLSATVAAYCKERGGDFMSDFVKKTPKKASNTLGKKYRK